MIRYPDGTIVTVQGTFKTASGVLIDPTTVSVRVSPPGVADIEYVYGVALGLVKIGVGIYSIGLDTTGRKGLWVYDFHSTGTGQASSEEKEFFVE